MDIGKITANGLLKEDNDEEEGQRLSYGAAHGLDPSEEKLRKARNRKAEHVYETFVRPLLEDLGEDFSEEEVHENIRPPYTEEEINRALEYGLEEGSLVYDEEVDLYRWDS